MNYNYTYTYETPTLTTGQATGILAALGAYMIFIWAIAIFMLVCMWRIFTKAGQAGWKSLIPIYNIIVLLQIAGLPEWYLVLIFIPFANIYLMFKLYIELAHKFGKSTGFGVLMIFFSIICIPILAFSKSAVYEGGNNNFQQTYNQPVNNGFGMNNGGFTNNQPINPAPTNNQFFNQSEQTNNVATPDNNQNQYNNQNQFEPVPTTNEPVGQPQQPTPEINPQANEPTMKFCTQCGKQVDVNAGICPYCGHNF